MKTKLIELIGIKGSATDLPTMFAGVGVAAMNVTMTIETWIDIIQALVGIAIGAATLVLLLYRIKIARRDLKPGTARRAEDLID